MALRQFVRKCSPPLWSFTSLSAKSEWIASIKGNSKNCLLRQTVVPSLIKENELNRETKLESVQEKKCVTSQQSDKFIDLFTNNAHKRLYMPTILINKLKVYQDINTLQKSIEDNRKIIKRIDPSIPGQFQKKEAVRMIRIRRRKMKKHKKKKLRKRMKFVFAKLLMKRELKKEQVFRTELLTQVEAAEKFDPKEYVANILHTLRYHPKPETEKERREKYRLKMKAHKYQTTLVQPNFDD